MAMKKKNSKRGTRKKRRDNKKEMIQFVRHGDFDKETTESLIKEIEEICAFEDSLEEFQPTIIETGDICHEAYEKG